MAHDFNKMVYVGEVPWHGLGVRLPARATYDEIVEAAGFYEAVERHVFIPPFNSPIPDKKALVRGDTGAYLSVVGKSYEVVQFADVARTLVEAAGDVKAVFTTAGTLGPVGIRGWLLGELPEPIKVRGDDSPIKKFVLGCAGHDGYTAVVIKNVATRVVCANTLGVALGERGGATWRIAHTASAKERLEEAGKAFARIARSYETFGNLANVMATTRFTGKQMQATIDGILTVPQGFEVDILLRLPDGTRLRERVQSPASTYSASVRWGAQREAILLMKGGDRNEKTDEPKRVPTFREFTAKFMTFSKTNNKPSTVYAKELLLRHHLTPAFGSVSLDRIGPAEIEGYKAKKLDEGYNKKSINNHLTALRKLLNLAVEWGELDRAPKVRGFRMKHEVIAEDEFLSFDEADRFLAAAAPEWRAFLVTGIKTGLRVGELLALKWQDVDLVAGQIIVRRTLWNNEETLPKGGRSRPLPLSDEVIATLKAHRHLRGPYVFSDEAGGRLTHSRVKDVVPSTCRKAGLAKRITNHGLRHTFASHLVMRGVSLVAVKELLGHESIEMTLRYAHLSPDVTRGAVQLLDGPAPTRARGAMVERTT